MYSRIPKEWRGDFQNNVTEEELNTALVTLHIPTIVLISVMMLVGIVGNILVLCIYTNYKASTYKSFIIWLGWMDLLACIVGKPALIISMLYPYMSPSEGLCRWSRSLHVFVSVSAALIFLAISYERYKKICFMDMHQLSYKRVNLMCLLATILAFVVAVPAMFVFGDAKVDTGVNKTGTECFIDEDYKNSYFPRVYFLIQLLLCLVSFFLMCGFYIRIGRTLKWHRRFVNDHTFKPKTTKAQKSAAIVTGSQSNGLKETPVKSDVMLLQCVKGSDNKDSNSEFNTSETEREMERGGKGDAQIAFSPSSKVSGKYDVSASRDNLNKSNRNLLAAQANEAAKQAQNLHTKEITKMMFIVTIVFILSFLPHLILMLMNSIKPSSLKELSPAGVVIYTIFLRTFVINNMANPIVYFVCLRSFRSMCFDKFRTILSCFKFNKTGNEV